MAVELQRRGGKAGSALGGKVPRGASGIEGEIEALRARAAALRAAGDDAAWLAVAERWAALAPQDARAFYHQGFAAKGLGRPEAAREAFAQAVRLAPTFSSARLELAVLLLAAGEVEATIDQLRVVVAQAPDNIQARVNLGVALRRAERPDEALQVYEAALALAPDHAELRQNLAELLIVLDRPDEALPHLQWLTELALPLLQQQSGQRPEDAQAQLRLGGAYRMMKRPVEAYACFRRSLQLHPGNPRAYLALAIMAHEARRYGLGEWLLRRVTAALPDDGEGWLMLGSMLYAQGRVEEADAAHAEAARRGLDKAGHHANALMYLNYRQDLPAAEIAGRHRDWGLRHGGTLQRAIPFGNTVDPERKLRIGYLSPDFRHHSVSYFLQPLIEAHDRDAVEICCYANVEKPDGLTERYRQLADRWHDVRKLDDAAVARAIEADGVDILVELAGHTGGSRLLVCALRPAPVQVSWLGYPNTTGLPAIDWRLVDAITDPPGSEALTVERLYRLPDGFLCYRPSDKAPEIRPLPLLERGGVTFGTFNNPAKLSAATIACWARILLALPQSRLLLGSHVLTDPLFRSRLRRRFQKLGVPLAQLDLRPGIGDMALHLGRYHEVDIGLDPFPYCGTTTTCESLWMGVPVVSLAGDGHVARVGASLLHRLGLDDLVATGEDAYVATAVRLAGDPARLATLRAGLRQRMQASPLMDATGFARQVEAAYRQMWRDWCARQPAAGQPVPRHGTHIPCPAVDSSIEPGGAAYRRHRPERRHRLASAKAVASPPPPAAPASTKTVASPPPPPLSKPVAARLERALRERRWDEAAGVAERVLKSRPGEAQAWRALTLARAGQGAEPARLLEAAAGWRAADPDQSQAPYRQGLALLRLGRNAEACEALAAATAKTPRFAAAWMELGVACSRLNDNEAAAGHFRQVTLLEPGNAQAHANLGAVLRRLGRLDEARLAYEAGLAQVAESAPLCRNLGNLLSRELCRPDEAAGYLRRVVELNAQRGHADLQLESDHLLNLNYVKLPPADIAAEHTAWGQRQMRRASRAVHPLPDPPTAERRIAPDPAGAGKRLRIGYLSPDLCSHSVSYFIAPVLAAHDRETVDIVVYADVDEPDAVTRRLRAEAATLRSGWRDVHGRSDAELAALIQEDGIDVLVELAGHTKGNRLAMLARRVAPVQASWLGYPNTTGLPAIDWRLVDAITDPPGTEALSVEGLCRLPHGFLAYALPENAPEVVPPPVLRRDFVTFGSFNNGMKLSQPAIRLWGRILAAVPNSRLLLKGFGLAPGRGEERIRGWLAEAGIGPERIRIEPHIPQRKGHLQLYGEMDIALDPFPYNGTTTTCEALWMGVPVLSLKGDRHAGRVGASILHRLGLDELVARDEDELLAKAVTLAGDIPRLTALREGMRQRLATSPLADARRLARDLEAAYREMWRRHCAGAAPAPLDLSASLGLPTPPEPSGQPRWTSGHLRRPTSCSGAWRAPMTAGARPQPSCSAS